MGSSLMSPQTKSLGVGNRYSLDKLLVENSITIVVTAGVVGEERWVSADVPDCSPMMHASPRTTAVSLGGANTRVRERLRQHVVSPYRCIGDEVDWVLGIDND